MNYFSRDCELQLRSKALQRARASEALLSDLQGKSPPEDRESLSQETRAMVLIRQIWMIKTWQMPFYTFEEMAFLLEVETGTLLQAYVTGARKIPASRLGRLETLTLQLGIKEGVFRFPDAD